MHMYLSTNSEERIRWMDYTAFVGGHRDPWDLFSQRGDDSMTLQLEQACHEILLAVALSK